MSPKTEQVEVRHNAAAHRFEADADGQLAVVDYVARDGTLILTHTYVPPAARGRGIAERLVRAAFAQAQAEGTRIVPGCSYVATFVRRHPEFQPLVAD